MIKIKTSLSDTHTVCCNLMINSTEYSEEKVVARIVIIITLVISNIYQLVSQLYSQFPHLHPSSPDRAESFVPLNKHPLPCEPSGAIVGITK